MKTIPRFAAVALALAAICSGCSAQTPTAHPSGAAAGEFPSGTYARIVTADEGSGLGIDAGTLNSILGDDGELKIELALENGAWTQYAVDSAGREVGDFGTYSFQNGRFVTVSQNTQSDGRVLEFDWSYDGATLDLVAVDTEGEPPPDPLERLMTEGTYSGPRK